MPDHGRRPTLGTMQCCGYCLDVRRIEVVRHPLPGDRRPIVDFVQRLHDRIGRPPLSDHLWLDLVAGSGDGLIAVTVWEGDRLLALAQASGANDGAMLELVVDDAAADRSDAMRIGHDAVETAIDAFARDGGGRLTWWVDGSGEDQALMAAELGLAPQRSLHEMRRPLPHPDRSEIVTRAFDPRTDAGEWLAVNNRAFADHGEQGGWTLATLALRMAEDWFDPEGFRIHEIDGTIAGFCWTKIHSESQPEIGEIYVIAVDPAFHGRGLGRQLTLAGLDSISDRGVTIANLYVDAGNTAAVQLYTRLGFDVHRTRTAFAGTLERRAPATTAPHGDN
jgi:mycothiol synthase